MNPRRLIFGLILSVSALALQAAPPDVSGTWKWDFERNGEVVKIPMNIKQDGSRISGKITGPEGHEVEIREGKIAEDGKLAFFIEIEREDNKMKVNFEGKASGDNITGKIKYTNPQGEDRERDWLAKREGKKHDLSGNWNSSFKRQDGTNMESTLTLKQDGDKLTGKSVTQFGETEIQDGRVQGTEVAFRIVRERDGRTVTAKYRGKLQADNSIKGQIESDWSGEVRRMDWEAKKQ